LTGFALMTAGQRIAAVERGIRRQLDPVDVVVASQPISAGQAFSEANLARKAVPSSGTGPRNVPAKDFGLLVGASAKNPIDPGEPVLWTDVEEPFDSEGFSNHILAGRRAFTIAADASSSFAGLLVPGDRVDLLAHRSDGGNAVWIRDLPVAAVDRIQRPSGDPEGLRDPATITLMVTPGEGARIAAAAAAGRLHWFLRNPADAGAAMRTPRRRASALAAVEVWKGGVRAPAPPVAPGSY